MTQQRLTVGGSDTDGHWLRAYSDRRYGTPDHTLYLAGPVLFCRAWRDRILVSWGDDRSGFHLDVIDAATLEPVAECSTETGAVHLATTDGGRVVASHYRSGEVTVWQVATARLDLVASIPGYGSSVHPRQESSHAHGALVVGADIVVADFGADRVRRYTSAGGEWTLAASWGSPAGSGPRNLARVGLGRLMVNTELTNAIYALDVDPFQEPPESRPLNTLPDGAEGGKASFLEPDPGGDALLVGNRGHDSVARIPLDGRPGSWIGTSGQPRDLVVTSDGRSAYAVTEDTGWLHEIDLTGESLALTGSWHLGDALQSLTLTPATVAPHSHPKGARK